MLQTAISSGNVNNGMIAFRMRPDPAAPTNDMDPALLKRVIQPPTLRSQPSGNEIQIEAHLFGRFSVSVNGVSVAPCSSSAGWSTLAYLLAQQRTSVPVDVLEGIFWPDASTHAARNNRNVALSHLRQALRLVSAHNIIEHHGGKYVFAQGCSLWTDAQDFEQCLANGRWLEANHRNEEAVARYKAALSLYQDDFLVDELYQDWALRKRDELRNAYIGILDRLSRLYFAQNNYAACVEVGQHILLRDRWREDVHCLLIRCYIRQSQMCFALKQFRDCVEAMRHEFNMAPSPDTLELHARILRREEV